MLRGVASKRLSGFRHYGAVDQLFGEIRLAFGEHADAFDLACAIRHAVPAKCVRQVAYLGVVERRYGDGGARPGGSGDPAPRVARGRARAAPAGRPRAAEACASPSRGTKKRQKLQRCRSRPIASRRTISTWGVSAGSGAIPRRRQRLDSAPLQTAAPVRLVVRLERSSDSERREDFA